MEQKHIVMSALGLGLGLGVGLGLASGQTVSRWAAPQPGSFSGVTCENIEQELKRLVVEGKDSKLATGWSSEVLIALGFLIVNDSEQTRVILTSAAYVHLKQADFSKYTRNLSPASRSILVSGPAALAHYFEAKLLLLDITDFSLKIQSKYGSAPKDSVRFHNFIKIIFMKLVLLYPYLRQHLSECLVYLGLFQSCLRERNQKLLVGILFPVLIYSIAIGSWKFAVVD
ncbi:hypothetical protein BHE74_00000821 [Ensete ventricosum]|uniref:Uncharacterized protein n=1 Tax=Ensete ventricosum TaxID=4639 RepID=A0A427B7G1_ENSVE|nr:hypothetical protein B296_00003734 [Ensete ventricosum]RWW33782.1 hypothetical protein GW17_00001477 [Ensete ventricosum]RWW90038.1 hypothetical protein BHE74_00000821 [Ensete ventricosum]RZR83903.1 hypothetical protein BHM03_00010612 [Ensete ventricosum]